MFYVYKITCLPNGKVYIGQTSRSIQRRFSEHYSSKNGSLIHKALRKYGKDNFVLEELAMCFSEEEVNKTEALAIKMFNSLHPNGYNLDRGGFQNRITDETKRKLSKSAKKRFAIKENNPMYGRKHSEETKLKLSKIHTGRKHTKETLQKLSKLNSGKNNARYGMTGSKSPMYGKPAPNRGIPMTEEAKNNRRITLFYKSVNDILERGIKVRMFTQKEYEDINEELSNNQFKKVVGLLFSHVIDRIKWSGNKYTREEKDEIVRLYRKIRQFRKDYPSIEDLLLKEVG
jgi:group I intron endonuclease